jgi:hemerythrin
VLIEWTDNLKLGLAEVDGQHQALAAWLNRLEAAALAPDPAAALAVLDALYAATRDHFAFEEQLMAEIAFPGAVAHRREHVMLAAELKSFIAAVRKGGERLDAAALAALKKWLVAHIIGSDRAFVTRFLEARGKPV